jgi:hypothetical protein
MDAPYSFVSIFDRVRGWPAAVSLAVMLGMCGLALVEARDDLRLQRDGVVVEAEVIGKGTHMSRLTHHHTKRTTKYDISYVFAVPDGREFSGKGSVSREAYDTLAVGSTVKVVYWREDPKLNRLAGESSAAAFFAVAAGIGALVSGWLVAARVLFVWRAITAREQGEVLAAKVSDHRERLSDRGWFVKVNGRKVAGTKDYWLDWIGPDGLGGSTLHLSVNELLDHPVGSDLTIYRHPTRKCFVISAAEVGRPSARSATADLPGQGGL